MPQANAKLRILATTDLHAHVCGWDYIADQSRPDLGLANLATLIDAARAECPNCLLVDNGDFLNGSPLGDWAAGPGQTAPHPVISAMNALRYDAATLGNHEFGQGVPLLARALAAARYAVVSANLRPVGDDLPLPVGALLRRQVTDDHGIRHPLAIGITGIAPRQTEIWERRHIAGRITCLDPVQSATAEVARLRAQGADIVLLLGHTGLGEDTPGQGSENVGRQLARESGADALILGHTHDLFPAIPDQPAHLGKTPTLLPGAFGSHLGRIDLTLTRSAGKWHVRHSTIALQPAQPTPAPHPAVATACAAAHRAARNWLAAPIGTSQTPLHSHFALLAPCDLLRLIAAAQSDHAHSLLPADVVAGRPILSATAPFRAIPANRIAASPTNIGAGPLSLRHAADLYPHPNTLVALDVTGADLANWLERATVLYHRLIPGGQDQTLLRSDIPGFDFDLIDGLSFDIDLSAPPRFDARGTVINPDARRIHALRHKGHPLRDADRFILVTNSYRAAGSGGFPACRPDQVLLDSDTPIRRIIADFIAGGGAERPLRGYDWRFAPLPGTTALVDLPPGAAAHLHDIAHLHPIALADQGQRFRLSL